MVATLKVKYTWDSRDQNMGVRTVTALSGFSRVPYPVGVSSCSVCIKHTQAALGTWWNETRRNGTNSSRLSRSREAGKLTPLLFYLPRCTGLSPLTLQHNPSRRERLDIGDCNFYGAVNISLPAAHCRCARSSLVREAFTSQRARPVRRVL